ncbi:hypothetical protein KAU32_12620 [bacterium]|nr:hypothetical protein [bacterium]
MKKIVLFVIIGISIVCFSTTDYSHIRSKKSPMISCGLSFIFPGLGHLYNQEYLKSGIVAGCFVLGIVFSSLNSQASATGDQYISGIFTWVFGVGAWLYGIIDAPISSIRINKYISRRYGHLFESNWDNMTLGFDASHCPNKVQLSLTLHL